MELKTDMKSSLVLERIILDASAEPTNLPMSLLEAITNNFCDGLEIGRGGFAIVYKGLLHNGIVAVKKLRQTLDIIHENKFNDEVGCLMRLKHKNIVRFLGYCADTQGKMDSYHGKMVMADDRQRLLCFEFLPNGSLNHYITDASQGLRWSTRYKIIKGICEGLHYLHQNNIVHRDLKPANILLTYDMVPKIADFGLSKCFDENQTQTITSKMRGSRGYFPPEFDRGVITLKIDIYSLGITILEILTGQKGYTEVDKVLKGWSDRFKNLLGDTRLEQQVRVCAEIGLECIDSNPAKRPTTVRIIEMLDEMEITSCGIETNLSSSTHEAKKGPTSLQQEKRQRELMQDLYFRKWKLREDIQIVVKLFLTRCAEALSEKRIGDFHKLVHEAREVVSITGEPIQRLGVYLLDGLVARDGNLGSNASQLMYLPRKGGVPSGNELLSDMKILYNICPHFKFANMAANGAIAEALRNEDKIHIIDFQIVHGTQWITLVQGLAARSGGPPSVRITGIDDAVSEYARGEGLELVGKMLLSMAEEFRIPLEFSPLPVCATEVTKEMLEIRPGEALAINFTLQLHRVPDKSVDVDNPRDALLRMVKGLSPKVITLVEHELNTNMAPFLMRFGETMDYYSTVFDSFDANLPRDSNERINMEQRILGTDIVNVIACEGEDRVLRHEPLAKWKSRLAMAGLGPYPLSSYVNSVLKKLLACYSDKYTLEEKGGALMLGWKNRELISASAWHRGE